MLLKACCHCFAMLILYLGNHLVLPPFFPLCCLSQVETAGDCYIVAGGLMREEEDGSNSVLMVVEPLNALHVFQFAKVNTSLHIIMCVGMSWWCRASSHMFP